MNAAKLPSRPRHEPSAEGTTPVAVEHARSLLRGAVGAQSGPFDWWAVLDWARRRSSSVDPLLLEGLFIGGTVNDQRRRHFPEPLDLVFRRDDGWHERFDVTVHGHWSKAGTPRLIPAGGPTAPLPELWEARGI
jgi:hypothetical protein